MPRSDILTRGRNETSGDSLERLRRLHAAHWPRGAPREAHYPFGEAPLTNYLRRHARERLQQTAIVFYGREYFVRGSQCPERPLRALLHERGVRSRSRQYSFQAI